MISVQGYVKISLMGGGRVMVVVVMMRIVMVEVMRSQWPSRYDRGDLLIVGKPIANAMMVVTDVVNHHW